MKLFQITFLVFSLSMITLTFLAWKTRKMEGKYVLAWTFFFGGLMLAASYQPSVIFIANQFSSAPFFALLAFVLGCFLFNLCIKVSKLRENVEQFVEKLALTSYELKNSNEGKKEDSHSAQDGIRDPYSFKKNISQIPFKEI
jgi:hypothetical protein